MDSADHIQPIIYSAPRSSRHVRTPLRTAVAVAIGVGSLAIAVATAQVAFALVLFGVAAIYYIDHERLQSDIHYRIDAQGVHMGGVLFPHADIRGWGVVQKPAGYHLLYLRLHGALGVVPLRLLLPPAIPMAQLAALLGPAKHSTRLTHEPLIDKWASWLGL